MATLLVTAAFAAWSWFKPYDWNPDPGARCKVVGCQLRKDRSFFWLDVHLEITPGKTHDLEKPVRLVMADGKELEPADTTLGGTEAGGTTDLWFKFWLESPDVGQAMKLRINDGMLVVRSNKGTPRLGSSGHEYFTTHRW